MKRKFLLPLAVFAILFTGCKKDETSAPQQDVVFTALQVEPSLEKSTALDWLCTDVEPTFAQIKINGVYYYPAVFTLDGKMYTQSIKLPDGKYDVQEFILYKDLDGVEGITTGDIITSGTPTKGYPFAEFVATPLVFSFTVSSFEKTQVEIEVLCYQPHLYDEFGFNWMGITEKVVRNQCFFGDICFKSYADYANSHYALQPGGLKIDMPAIFRIDVYRNGTPMPAPYFSFTNDVAPNYGVGSPVCVSYPDNLSIQGEEFRFELFILVNTGSTFSYVKFHTWTFKDAEVIPAGDDGVVDFVLGNCNFSDTDLQLPPYIDLPTTANVTLTYPGTISYWSLTVNSVVPSGAYDFPLGKLAAWCGDHNTSLEQGTMNAYLYNSLNSATWPAGVPFTQQTIAKINWLFNHLGDFGMNQATLTSTQFNIIQSVIWKIINGYTGATVDPAKETLMFNAVNLHGDYVPLPGGWAAVLFIKDNTATIYQMIFTVVDP